MSLLNDVRRGSQQPSRKHLPALVATSEAAERAIDLASIAGLELDDWQQDCLRVAMSQRSDQRWSAFEVGVVVPRQAGKGAILEARQLAGLFDLGERLQLHSAHEFKTCFEHFRRVKDLVEGCDLLRRQVRIIRTGAGDQSIELVNGNRIRFIARSRSSGRGFSGDAVYLDEAFLLTDSAMGALLPALSARPNPQIWYTSSAPHADSEVLHRVRKRALTGDESRMFFAEWSCDVGADPEDRDNWYRANPALGVRISEESVESELRSLSPAEFARERLGIPDEPIGEADGAIPFEVWSPLADKASLIESHQQWALVVAPDRKWASLGKAGRAADGRLHVEWMWHRAGTGWIVDQVCEHYAAKPIPLRVHKSGPEAAFIGPLRERGVEVVEVSTGEVAQATGQIIDAASNRQLVHLGQPSLDKSVRGAVLRLGSDGASVWSQRQSSVEITPLQAVTVAAGGVPDLVGVSEGQFYDLDDFAEE